MKCTIKDIYLILFHTLRNNPTHLHIMLQSKRVAEVDYAIFSSHQGR